MRVRFSYPAPGKEERYNEILKITMGAGIAKIYFFSSLFVSYFLFFNPVLAAAPLDVVISEVAWMGTKEDWRAEWLELFNNRQEEIDVSGWKIENAGTKNKVLTISQSKIPGAGFFLICKKQMPGCDFVSRELSLANDYQENGKLVLRDDLGNLIDQTPEPITKNWPAGSNQTKQTMERKDFQAQGLLFENWATSQGPGGTPKTKNALPPVPSLTPFLSLSSTPSPTPSPTLPVVYSSAIQINEILPSPDGPDDLEEWIELKNFEDKETALSQWKIQDAKDAIFTFPEEIKISANGFLVFSRPQTKIVLNNDNDSLLLIQPDNNVLDKVDYQKAPQGQSYNRSSVGWAWSDVLTPGRENILSSLILKTEAKEAGKDETEKTGSPKELSGKQEQLAAVGEQISDFSEFLNVFLIALGFALLSGTAALFLKKKFKAKK